MDPILRLEDVSKMLGRQQVLRDFNLSIQPGEFVTLLGPSGCGKSTTLNLIAGLLQPDAGAIYLRGTLVNHVEPRKRRLGMVFQSWALFPHMTVHDNVAFGLQMKGWSRSAIAQRVQEMLELVRLPAVPEKYPSQLSGGMQQRVALARALADEPDILLLDEPLSNLDARLRKEMQVELKRIHERLGVTTLFVTHSQEEALVMSDRVAVMNLGRIVRMGAPVEVYNNPGSRFVCTFLGEANIFDGHVKALDGTSMLIQSGEILLRAESTTPMNAGQQVSVAVRPEQIRVREARASSADNSLVARITDIVYKGDNISFYLDAHGKELLAVEHPKDSIYRLKKGTEVFAEFESSAFSILEDA